MQWCAVRKYCLPSWRTLFTIVPEQKRCPSAVIIIPTASIWSFYTKHGISVVFVYLSTSLRAKDVNVASAGAVRVQNGLPKAVYHSVHLDGGGFTSTGALGRLIVLQDDSVTGDRRCGKLAVILVVHVARKGSQLIALLTDDVEFCTGRQVKLTKQDGDGDGTGGLDHGPPNPALVDPVRSPFTVTRGHVQVNIDGFPKLERTRVHELFGLGRLQQCKVVQGGEGDDGPLRKLSLAEALWGEAAFNLDLTESKRREE